MCMSETGWGGGGCVCVCVCKQDMAVDEEELNTSEIRQQREKYKI